jgi:hypothetical protein
MDSTKAASKELLKAKSMVAYLEFYLAAKMDFRSDRLLVEQMAKKMVEMKGR